MRQRIGRDVLHLIVAFLYSKRSTCARREVGCVLVDKEGHVLATGYNGVASGDAHCIDEYPCASVGAESGTRHDECRAVHAEQNALLQCRDVSLIHTAYCTTFPCATCLKLLRNTGCKRIVYSDPYDNPLTGDVWPRDREVLRIPLEDAVSYL